MAKTYLEMTPAERIADRIAKNRGMNQGGNQKLNATKLDELIAHLDFRKQRASYGAVAKLVGGNPQSLMNGRPHSKADSWVVAADGPTPGWPTGYTPEEIHPDCLRQIEAQPASFIADGDNLKKWLKR